MFFCVKQQRNSPVITGEDSFGILQFSFLRLFSEIRHILANASTRWLWFNSWTSENSTFSLNTEQWKKKMIFSLGSLKTMRWDDERRGWHIVVLDALNSENSSVWRLKEKNAIRHVVVREWNSHIWRRWTTNFRHRSWEHTENSRRSKSGKEEKWQSDENSKLMRFQGFFLCLVFVQVCGRILDFSINCRQHSSGSYLIFKVRKWYSLRFLDSISVSHFANNRKSSAFVEICRKLQIKL